MTSNLPSFTFRLCLENTWMRLFRVYDSRRNHHEIAEKITIIVNNFINEEWENNSRNIGRLDLFIFSSVRWISHLKSPKHKMERKTIFSNTIGKSRSLSERCQNVTLLHSRTITFQNWSKNNGFGGNILPKKINWYWWLYWQLKLIIFGGKSYWINELLGQVSGESVSTGTRTRKMKTVTRPCGRKPFGYPFGGSTFSELLILEKIDYLLIIENAPKRGFTEY